MKISLCMPIVLIFHAVIENSSQVKLREQKLACLDLLPSKILILLRRIGSKKRSVRSPRNDKTTIISPPNPRFIEFQQ